MQCVDKVVDVSVVQVDGSSKQGVNEFFVGVKGVGDVLAGVEQGDDEFFAGVNGVGNVLARRGAWC